MNPLRATCILLAVLVLPYTRQGLSLPTEECTGLDVFKTTREASPRTGVQLPYCKTSELQCCTSSYLDNLRKEVLEKVLSGAQADLLNVFRPWNQTYYRLTETVKEFVTKFIDNFPFPKHLLDIAQPYLEMIKPILAAQLLPDDAQLDLSFNFTEFTSELTFTLVELFISSIQDPYTVHQKMCLSGILVGEIQTDAIDRAGEAMKDLQMVYQSLARLQSFVNSLSVDELGYSPSDQCLEALLSQQCEQCKANIPTLCQDVCTSVMIACLSPIQNGLQSQAEAVWNVTKQLTLLTQQLIKQVLRNYQPSILPASALPKIIQNTFQECGINLYEVLNLSGKKKRDVSTIDLPADLEPAVQQALAINGVFFFNSHSLPSYCESTSSERECWNGRKETENGTVVSEQQFMRAHIEDQRDNPVYKFDTASLHQQAASLNDLTSEFLQGSNLLQVLPSSIQIPLVDPYEYEIATVKPSSTTSATLSQTPTQATPLPTVSPSDREILGKSGASGLLSSESLILTMTLSVFAFLFVFLVDKLQAR